MPKLKTKSGAKKRFKLTGTGKVVYVQRGKRHGMIKRTTKQIRNLRGTAVLFKTDGDKVKVTLRFRGREMAHQELGTRLLDRVKGDIAQFAKVESDARFEGRQMVMILAPR